MIKVIKMLWILWFYTPVIIHFPDFNISFSRILFYKLFAPWYDFRRFCRKYSSTLISSTKLFLTFSANMIDENKRLPRDRGTKPNL